MHGVLARVIRSGFDESLHYGTAVALDPAGQVLARVGDPGAPIFPRSSMKPLQAAAMLRAGLDLDGSLLALAAASHSGERFHTDGVQRILASVGLEAGRLGNVADLPLDEDERLAWRAAGRAATPVAMNCSGKHAAMLATCRVNDWPLQSYLDPGHPLQRAIAATVTELAGEPVAAVGTDGCGAPLLAISTAGLARAFGRIATAPDGSAEQRVADAIRRHPEWLGGTGRDVTELIRAVPGLIAKDGAEGVYAAALPDGRAAAVKVSDGAGRVRPVVMAALLCRLGVPPEPLADFGRAPVLGGGSPVGWIEPAPELSGTGPA
jgi:L-asparaginase II